MSNKLFLPAVVTAFSLMARKLALVAVEPFGGGDWRPRFKVGDMKSLPGTYALTQTSPGASWTCRANPSFTGPSTEKSPLNMWEDLEGSQGANVSFQIRDNCETVSNVSDYANVTDLLTRKIQLQIFLQEFPSTFDEGVMR